MDRFISGIITLGCKNSFYSFATLYMVTVFCYILADNPPSKTNPNQTQLLKKGELYFIIHLYLSLLLFLVLQWRPSMSRYGF